MKLLLTLSALLLGFVPRADDLATHYETGKALRIETRTAFELELTEVTRDGKPVENPRGGGVAEELSSVVVDRWLECADGRPVRVRRTFEEAGGKAKVDLRGKVQEQPIESPLQGVVVELSRDAKGKVEREVVEGEAPADESLDRLGLALELDALLPDHPVEVGAIWDLEAEPIRRALGFELAEALFPRSTGEGAVSENGGDRPLADADWTGTAKYTGTEEHAGEDCYVVELTLAGKREIEDERARTSFEAELTGKLWVAGAERRPAGLELGGELTAQNDVQRERQGNTLAVRRFSAGTFELSVAIEPAPFETK